MRRLSLVLVAACGIAVLSACNSTGYAFTGTNSGGSVDTIVFMNGSGQTNDYFLSPNGSSPLLVSAIGSKNGFVVPNATFTWTVGFLPAGTTYLKGPTGTVVGTCGAPANTQVPQYYTLLTQGTPSGPVPSPSGGMGVAPLPGEASPQFGGYVIYNPARQIQTIYVAPVLDPTKLPAVVPIAPEGEGTNYCLTVIARQPSSGVIGSVTVVVSNSP